MVIDMWSEKEPARCAWHYLVKDHPCRKWHGWLAL